MACGVGDTLVDEYAAAAGSWRRVTLAEKRSEAVHPPGVRTDGGAGSQISHSLAGRHRHPGAVPGHQ